MDDDHDHSHDDGHEHSHDHGHEHGHGHANDRGIRGIVRYLRFAPQMWRSDINRLVIDLVDPSPGELTVDIGAGMGAGTVLAAKRRVGVVAVEPTPFLRTVLSARRWFQRARKRIDVRDGAAEALPIADHRADAVWSVNAMHHWVDPDQAAAEIARALRPGGRVVLVDEVFTDPTHPDYERFGGGDDDDSHHGFTMVDADRMGALLDRVGLIDVDAAERRLDDRPVIAIIATAPR